MLAVMAAGWVGTATADDTPANQSPPAGSTPRGTVVTPGSSIAKPEDLGTRAHTNTKVFVLTPRSPANTHPDTDRAGTPPPEPVAPGADSPK